MCLHCISIQVLNSSEDILANSVKNSQQTVKIELYISIIQDKHFYYYAIFDSEFKIEPIPCYGHIDVGDRCWTLNVLVTSLRC